MFPDKVKRLEAELVMPVNKLLKDLESSSWPEVMYGKKGDQPSI